MPEAQTPAPAPAATPDTPAPVTAPAAEAAAPEKPKLRGKARHAEIKANLAKAKAAPKVAASEADTPKPDAPAPIGDPPKPDEPKPADEAKDKKPVGAVMRLTAENTKLKQQIDDLQKSAKAETVESLRAKVKKNPAVLLEVFGGDIAEDENERLTKLNDAVLAAIDPAHAAERERDERVAKLEKELEQERAAKQTLAEKDIEDRRAGLTAKWMTEGYTAANGQKLLDPSKFPYVNHLSKAGEVDVHRGIAGAVHSMASDFIKANDRRPTDDEIADMHRIAAEKAEAHFSKRAKNWQLPQAAAPAPSAPATPTTIGSGMGSRAGATEKPVLRGRARHEEIRRQLRAASASRSAPN